MTFLRYVMIRAFQNMNGSLFPNLTTIGIIGISVLIFSAFSLFALNLSAFLKVWEDKIAVIAYLKKGVPLKEVEKLLKNTRRLEGVETVKYLSPFDAMAFMEGKLDHQRNLLEGIPPGVLPSSLEIQLKKEYRNSTRIKEVVSKLKQFPEIEEVQYGQEWVEPFSAIVHMVGLAQWILGGLLLAGMTFIISNTVQLTLSSRREEIEMMYILGASSAHIQVPFYIEGLVQGLLGAGLAVIFLSLLYYNVLLYKFFFQYLTPPMKEWFAGIPVVFLPGRTLGMIISGGMILGLFGSFLASMRYRKYSG